MKLDGIGVTQPKPFAPYRVRLQFGKKYLTMELERGQEQEEIAKRLRELAQQVEQLRA